MERQLSGRLCRLMVSDTSQWQQAMLATKLNLLIADNSIQTYGLIQLQEYICIEVNGKDILIILRLRVASGSTGAKIGHPVERRRGGLSAMEEVAQELGIPITRSDGSRHLEAELRARLLTRTRALRHKADLSELIADETVADCTVRVLITHDDTEIEDAGGRPKVDGRHVSAQSSEEKEEHNGEETGVKRQRLDVSGAELCGSRMNTATATSAVVVSTTVTASCMTSAAALNSNRAAASSTELDVRVLKGHSSILAVQSHYFKRALGGAFRESATKTVDIALTSEEEYETFCRLFRLAYMPSYTIDDDGKPLDGISLAQLMVMADRFEFINAVQECADTLQFNDVAWDDAVMLFDVIPGALVAENATFQSVVARAGDALAECLGPVAGLLKPAALRVSSMSTPPNLQKLFVLDERVRALPLCAFEAVLKSDKLRVSSENEPYIVMLLWLTHQKSEDRFRGGDMQDVFDQLVTHIRFEHLSSDFLADVATAAKLFRSSAVASRLMSVEAQELDGEVVRCPEDGGGGVKQRRQRDRVCRAPSPPLKSWDLEGSFTLAECVSVQQGGFLVKSVGLVNGFPVVVHIGPHTGPKAAPLSTWSVDT